MSNAISEFWGTLRNLKRGWCNIVPVHGGFPMLCYPALISRFHRGHSLSWMYTVGRIPNGFVGQSQLGTYNSVWSKMHCNAIYTFVTCLTDCIFGVSVLSQFGVARHGAFLTLRRCLTAAVLPHELLLQPSTLPAHSQCRTKESKRKLFFPSVCAQGDRAYATPRSFFVLMYFVLM